MLETTEESRKAKRLELQIPVRLTRQPDPNPGNSFYISSLTELSQDGAFVKTSAAYQKGSMIAMDFELPSKSAESFHVHALGRIAWEGNPETKDSRTRMMGVGVQFVLMTQEEKKLISDFINGQKNIPTPPRRKVPRA